MHRLALLTTALLFGCNGVATTVNPPNLPHLSVADVPDAPEVIAVRIAVVAWQDAEGAPERVTRSQEQASVRAEVLSGLARQPGQSFREIQTQYGDGARTQLVIRRGDGQLEPEVEQAAFALRVGQRSRQIETPRGYVIVAREADPELGPTQIWARHILISFVGARRMPEGVERTREDAEALVAQLLAQLAEDPTQFEVLAGEYSDEPGALERGGDLGPFARGAMVAAFERVAFTLEVNQISPLVETPFGFHIIQRYR
jgi:PPIC-type PPIASE domain